MRFSIYLRRFGKLIKLYRLHRSPTGLYIWASQSSNYTSWHEDGRYWIRSRGRRHVKKLQQPLIGFKGTESLCLSTQMITGPWLRDKADGQVKVRPEDIVFEIDGHFAIEIILSEDPPILAPLLERASSIVFVRDTVRPIITVEVFPITSGVLPPMRFPSATQWIEGINFFVDHRGKI